MIYFTLKQLRVFVAIYRHSTTTLAAKHLSLSQSAVSSAIGDLENQLDTRLFERAGKRLIINESSRILYPKAQALLDQAESIEQLFQQTPAKLHIGASTTIGNYLLPKLIAQFSKQYPNIDIVLHIHNSEYIVNELQYLHFDIGFIEGDLPPSNSDLHKKFWKNDELILFATSNSRFIGKNRLTIDDISKIPLITRELGSGTRTAVERRLLSQLTTLPKLIEIGHSEAIKQAVIHDIGIGCLSTYIVKEAINDGTLQRLYVEMPPIKRNLWQLYNKNKFISPALQYFMDYCQQESDLFK